MLPREISANAAAPAGPALVFREFRALRTRPPRQCRVRGHVGDPRPPLPVDSGNGCTAGSGALLASSLDSFTSVFTPLDECRCTIPVMSTSSHGTAERFVLRLDSLIGGSRRGVDVGSSQFCSQMSSAALESARPPEATRSSSTEDLRIPAELIGRATSGSNGGHSRSSSSGSCAATVIQDPDDDEEEDVRRADVILHRFDEVSRGSPLEAASAPPCPPSPVSTRRASFAPVPSYPLDDVPVTARQLHQKYRYLSRLQCEAHTCFIDAVPLTNRMAKEMPVASTRGKRRRVVGSATPHRATDQRLGQAIQSSSRKHAPATTTTAAATTTCQHMIPPYQLEQRSTAAAVAKRQEMPQQHATTKEVSPSGVAPARKRNRWAKGLPAATPPPLTMRPWDGLPPHYMDTAQQRRRQTGGIQTPTAVMLPPSLTKTRTSMCLEQQQRLSCGSCSCESTTTKSVQETAGSSAARLGFLSRIHRQQLPQTERRRGCSGHESEGALTERRVGQKTGSHSTSRQGVFARTIQQVMRIASPRS